MKKIIIFGFPHCGTTILRCIISHIDDVYEIVDETNIIDDEFITNKSYTLIKYPYTFDELFTSKYDDYIKIFTIRNPLYVYSSLNKRFKNTKIDNQHSIDNYIKCIEKFRKYRYKDINNLYCIKYEDLFDNNYENLKIY